MLVIVLEMGTCGVGEPTDWAGACTETFLCKLCRTRGVVHTERTLDCGVSPLVKGVLSLLMSPLMVGSSACGDIKSCDVVWWCSKKWDKCCADVRKEQDYVHGEVVSEEKIRFVPTYLIICGLASCAR